MLCFVVEFPREPFERADPILLLDEIDKYPTATDKEAGAVELGDPPNAKLLESEDHGGQLAND